MSHMSLLGITQLKARASKKWSWLRRDPGAHPENISLCRDGVAEQDRGADRWSKRCSVRESTESTSVQYRGFYVTAACQPK